MNAFENKQNIFIAKRIQQVCSQTITVSIIIVNSEMFRSWRILKEFRINYYSMCNSENSFVKFVSKHDEFCSGKWCLVFAHSHSNVLLFNKKLFIYWHIQVFIYHHIIIINWISYTISLFTRQYYFPTSIVSIDCGAKSNAYFQCIL